MPSWFSLPFPRAVLDLWNRGSGRGEEPGGARRPPPDSDPFSEVNFEKISLVSQGNSWQPKMAVVSVRQFY